MIFRFWYFIRETFVSLWRNLSLTLAAILTVAISLALVGSSLLIREGANQATAQFQEGVEFIVFMNADALENQNEAIRKVLDTSLQLRSMSMLINLQLMKSSESFLLISLNWWRV